MKPRESDRGVTLVETMIATLIALVGVFSLGSVVFQATVTNKNQGTETTRAVVYAQDKIEKLLSLDFTNCTQAASSQPSSCNSTNIADSGWTQGLLAGGPISATAYTTTPVAPACPSVPSASQGYVDFLDANGLQLPSGGGACSSVTGAGIAYVREWSITDLTAFSGGPAMKRITVAVYSNLGVGSTGSGKPIVVITSVRSNPN
jgi:Tfp pilus assembly protein PilE